MAIAEGKKLRSFLFIILFLGGLLPPFFIVVVSIYGFSSGPNAPGVEIPVLIPPDSSFKSITTTLVDKKIIRPDIRFRILAGLMGVTDKLRAGEYLFNGPQTPYQIIQKLARGSMVLRAVTIPEGANLSQISRILAREGWLNRERFLELCKNIKFITSLGLSVSSLEGYLFPDTYFFDRGGISPENIITIMVNRMRQILAEKATPPTIDVHELLTLASIVEKETARSDERPMIARVFLNRLEKGMKLQTDPTVIYGLNKFDGNLTREHLNTPTPYNTYVIKGLPPGPIGNPGEAAIEAVINPAEGSYYYFVSKNDGSHYFSKSLKEHNLAVSKYQKRRFIRKKRRSH